jgi:ADP-ribose pyrophosphatase YjhB (NUDIX family)
MPHLNDPGTDLTVDVFVVHEDRVLLRVHDKFGVWLTPGGHIERHESPNEAALREVMEEVGLQVELVPPAEFVELAGDALGDGRDLIPPRYVNEHAISPTHRHVTLIYFARPLPGAATAVAPQLAEDRSDRWHWWTTDELRAPNSEVPRVVREHALAALSELRAANCGNAPC